MLHAWPHTKLGGGAEEWAQLQMPGGHDCWLTWPVALHLHLCELLPEPHPELCSCRKTAQIRMLMGKSAGGFSGGTIASLMGAMFDETPEELRLSADPYALNPPHAHR